MVCYTQLNIYKSKNCTYFNFISQPLLVKNYSTKKILNCYTSEIKGRVFNFSIQLFLTKLISDPRLIWTKDPCWTKPELLFLFRKLIYSKGRKRYTWIWVLTSN